MQGSKPQEVNIDIDKVIQCPICFCQIQPHELLHPLACKHSFCKECISQYIEDKIQCSQINKIPCPTQKCLQKFGEDSIKPIISVTLYEKYKRLLIQRSKDLRIKICPA